MSIGSAPTVRTMGDEPADASAPTEAYMAVSEISPCSQSTMTHYMHFSIVSEKSPTLHSFRGRLILCRYEAKTDEYGNQVKRTSAPSPPTRRASEYPGNQIHSATQGAPPSLARSSAARRRVLPFVETIADLETRSDVSEGDGSEGMRCDWTCERRCLAEICIIRRVV